MGETVDIQSDLVQVVRLAILEQSDDVRLFIARLVRKYRNSNPELAELLDRQLRTKAPSSSTPLRKAPPLAKGDTVLPVDDESRLSLLKICSAPAGVEQPLLSGHIEEALNQLIQERRHVDRLAALGLHPTRSAIFVGKPGVGKTLTARWLAAKLNVPLYVLDLTAIMSSLLGRSGSNLRAALDFAKQSPCVLLLDEIDAIAKRRNDDADVGELKRLVTVILQEVDEWPSTGLLLAATNHPELIDPALWRRFDLVLEFKAPEMSAVSNAVKRFLGPDLVRFERWIDVLSFVFKGTSFSDIERDIQRMRRMVALGVAPDMDLISEHIKARTSELGRQERIQLAVHLIKQANLSQHAVSDITGVSRDTIRKYCAENTSSRKKGGNNKKEA